MIEFESLLPGWSAPANVRALVTTRRGGTSLAPYDGMNLGMHVGDDPLAVRENRGALMRLLPSEPVWLDQVHGAEVIDAAALVAGEAPPAADASVTWTPGPVCVVMSADCLPVILCDRAGSVVAAAHAGWRGLAGGVLEATISRMSRSPESLMAWLGPAIGPNAFEVGDEVRATFAGLDPALKAAFTPTDVPGKWMADLYLLARLRLNAAGVTRISGGGLCTFRDSARFFSYRRDGVTGRFATMVWLAQ